MESVLCFYTLNGFLPVRTTLSVQGYRVYDGGGVRSTFQLKIYQRRFQVAQVMGSKGCFVNVAGPKRLKANQLMVISKSGDPHISFGQSFPQGVCRVYEWLPSNVTLSLSP